MKIHADRDRCIGAGLCALNAPTIFDQDDDGMVVLLDSSPTLDNSSDARRLAEDICPSKAIRITDG
ncbi:ferredoxin [Streptomyces sp. P38-E01]|uniref:Ferredoxin n=1 Tax=Streptomyces tardus TaxID=2780544 RepID=A0A949JND3_9ACTN|nr:ferredoxin [Streptomyces tardus]MBU7597295.1 ferredoxin [Streptomyces tardus]